MIVFKMLNYVNFIQNAGLPKAQIRI